MSKVMKRPGRIGSEFMLAKGRGRCKVGRKETGEKKKTNNNNEPVVG